MGIIGGAEGPTAIFIAGKDTKESRKHISCSALHFNKISQVEWRPIFYMKDREDLKLIINISGPMLEE